MVELEQVSCGQCGIQVLHVEGEPRIPCHSCGSAARKFGVSVSETIQVAVSLGTKAKHESATGAHKWFIESFDGWSLHRDSGEMRKVSQVIHRENDRYRKLVTDIRGKVLRDIDERLSVHRERGDAKPKGE